MKKNKVAEIFITDQGNSKEMRIVFNEAYPITKKLGILEWAKAIIIEDTKQDNILAKYGVEEL